MPQSNTIEVGKCSASDRLSVFISYTHVDDFCVKPVEQYLRDHEVQTTIDDCDFIAGHLLEDEILRNLKQADKVVLMYSKNSASRRYPELERRIAENLEVQRLKKGMLIFFCLDDTQLPPSHQDRIAIYAYKKGFDKACEHLYYAITEKRIEPTRLNLHDFDQKPPWKMDKNERALIIANREKELRSKQDYDKKFNYAIESLQDECRPVKLQATRDLGRLRDPKALPALADALKDEDGVVRAYAAKALGQIGDPKALDLLVSSLQLEERYARNEVVRAIGRLGDTASNVLENILKEDKDSEARSIAAAALGTIADNRAVSPLIKALKDEHYRVRASAADALGEIGEEEALEPLTYALHNDVSGDVRWSADVAILLIKRRHRVK